MFISIRSPIVIAMAPDKIDPETGMAKERVVDIIGDDSAPPEIPPLGEELAPGEGGEEAAPPEEQGIPQVEAGGKKYRCKYCGAEFTNPLELGRHINMMHQAELAARRARRAGALPQQPQAGEGEAEESHGVPLRASSPRRFMNDDEIFADIKIRGQVALEELLRERLEQLLSMPSVPKESREYVLREWDNDPSMHFDFHAISEALYDAGIKPDKAQRIVDRLIMLYNKFAPALAMPPTPPQYVRAPDQQYWPRQYPAQAGPQYPAQYNPYGNPYPSPYGYNPYGNPYPSPYGYNPYAPPPPPPPPPQQPAQQLTEDSVRKIVKETLSEILQKPEEKDKEGGRGDEMEAEIPIAYDKDGTPIMGRVRGNPAAIVGMIIASGSSRGQAPDESVQNAVKAMQAQLESLQAQLREAEKRADEAEKRRLEDRISDLQSKIETMDKTYKEMIARKDEQLEKLASMPRGEYKSDVLRMVDSITSRAENIIRDRRPLDKLIDLLVSQPQQARPTSDESAIEELKKLGLAVQS
jgi:hypothetical protein